MTDREKLVGLLDNFGIDDDWYTNTEIADYLLANDVTFVTDNNDGSKWIPVSERLPEPFEDVLLYVGTEECVSMAYMTRHKEWCGIPIKSKVTHWMPLPEQPKE